MSEIVELSNANADSTSAPGDYSCSFPPRALHRGDLMYLKSACLSTTIQDPQQQIKIDEDTQIEIEVAFWEYDAPIDPGGVQQFRAYYPPAPGPPWWPPNRVNQNPTYLQYLAMKWVADPYPAWTQHYELLTKTITFTLAAGVYTPQSIAEALTRGMVTIDESQWPSPAFMTAGYGRTPLAPLVTEFGPPTTGDGGYQHAVPQFLRMEPDITEAPDPPGTGLPTGALNLNDRYDYVIAVDPPGGGDVQLLGGIMVYIGAQQAAVTFDDGGSGAFAFSWLHTPIMDPATVDETPLVGEYYAALAPYPGRAYLGADCGCFLVGLRPEPFWTRLGFNLGAPPLEPHGLPGGATDGTGCLIATRPAGPNNVPPPALINFDRRRHMTSGLVTAAEVTTLARRIRPVMMPPMGASSVIHNSAGNSRINAKTFFQPDASPSFLVEISANWDASRYTDGRDTSRSISAIVPRAWTANDYVLGFSDSAIVYRHDSDVPLVLSSARVRVLNALTKELDPSVDSRNIVFLAIERAVPSDGQQGPPAESAQLRPVHHPGARAPPAAAHGPGSGTGAPSER